MRPADINRVKRAREYLVAAEIALSSIKWKDINLMESKYLRKAKDGMVDVEGYLDEIKRMQK